MKPTKSTNSTASSPSRKPERREAKTTGARRPWWHFATAVFGALLLLAAAGAAVFAADTQRIVRGVTIGGLSVGGRTSLETLTLVKSRWKAFADRGFTFRAGSQTITIPVAGVTRDEEEVILDLANFDPQAAVDAAYAFGHDGPWWQQLRQRASGWLGRRHEVGRFSVDTVSLRKLLVDQLAKKETPARNASIVLAASGTIGLTPSGPGKSFAYDQAVRQAVRQTRTIDSRPIAITQVVVQPTIGSSPTLRRLAEKEAPLLLARAPLTITAGDKSWTLDRARMTKLVDFTVIDGRPAIGFGLDKTTTYLETLRSHIDVAAQNAKFSMSDGRVKEFQASVTGRTLDIPASIKAMNDELVVGRGASTELVIETEKPLTDTVTTNDLGIKELVAEGRTNFRGSPPNRRYNLGYGAEKLNGLLIKPGETFSLVAALGEIDGAHGWKPELVIKQGGRITPEFGGGLCQVATTLFRAVLNAGLPVVERSNHSLRISYYEPPVGLDATIYDPHPDLRFTNDYPTYLLLQTRIEGDNLIFSFYGTSDGRTVDLPTPKVYNQVPIPAPKTIETDELKPGEKQCQAPGHPGADATATYTVTKADGTKVTQVFQSHYRAIGVICRVGKAKPKS